MLPQVNRQNQDHPPSQSFKKFSEFKAIQKRGVYTENTRKIVFIFREAIVYPFVSFEKCQSKLFYISMEHFCYKYSAMMVYILFSYTKEDIIKRKINFKDLKSKITKKMLKIRASILAHQCLKLEHIDRFSVSVCESPKWHMRYFHQSYPFRKIEYEKNTF